MSLFAFHMTMVKMTGKQIGYRQDLWDSQRLNSIIVTSVARTCLWTLCIPFSKCVTICHYLGFMIVNIVPNSLLYSLEQAAIGIDISVNLDKTGFMCFDQDGAISSISSKPLKLDQFRYLGRIISSTVSYVNIH